MSEKIEFTRNYSDQSTNQGFQFEFYCDRCGTGYRTHFQPFALGTVSNALDAASNLFGGIFGQAADLSERVHSKMAEEDREMLQEKCWRDGVRATCPSCNTPLAANVKFCPECGTKV